MNLAVLLLLRVYRQTPLLNQTNKKYMFLVIQFKPQISNCADIAQKQKSQIILAINSQKHSPAPVYLSLSFTSSFGSLVCLIVQSAILLYLKYRNQEKQRMSSQVADTSVANFIQKSFEILQNKEYEAIIHWMANGREFAIKQIDEFQDHILPKYFRHRNINSFIRQLNMYGFHKSRKDPSKNIFSHPFFLRGQPNILHLVRRKIKNQDKAQQQNKTPLPETPQPKKKIQNLEHTTDIQSKKSFQSLSTLKDTVNVKNEKEVVTTKTEIVMAPTFSMISLGSFGLKFPTNDVSPFKGMMQKSCIMDSNPELYLKMRDHNSMGQCEIMIQDDDDNLSIDDQIQRQRRVFLNRRSGVTILQTSNLLQDLEFQ